MLCVSPTATATAAAAPPPVPHNKNVTQRSSLELNFMLNPGIEHVTFLSRLCLYLLLLL